MSKRARVVVVGVLLVAGLACGPLGNLGNLGTNNQVGPADALWSDGPAYPGADKVDAALPLPLRLAVQAASQSIGFRMPGDSGTLQDTQFIGFASTDTSEQVQSYYSNDRMADEGWDTELAPGCGAASAGEQSFGTMCVFAKETDAQNTALFLFTSASGGETQIFYVRLEGTP